MNIPLEELRAVDEFDLVFAFEVLEHMNDPLGAIEIIRRLLRGGGVFCGTSPYPYSWNVRCDETHMYVLHPAGWEMLFIRGGFEDVRIYPVSIIPAMWRIHKRLNPIVPLYIPVKYFVSTSLIVARRQG